MNPIKRTNRRQSHAIDLLARGQSAARVFTCWMLCAIGGHLSRPAVAATSEKSPPAAVNISLPTAELHCTAEGLGLTSPQQFIPPASGAGGVLWTMRLQSTSVPTETLEISSREQAPTLEKLPDGYRLRYANLTASGATHAIRLTLELSSRQTAFSVAGTLENRTEQWCVVGFEGPMMTGIQTVLERHPLLLPNGFGMKVHRTPAIQPAPAKGTYLAPAWTKKKDGSLELRSVHQSSLGSMPWCALAGEEGGLYVGCHDPRQGAKSVVAGFDPRAKRFRVGFDHLLVCLPGGSWALPPVMYYPFSGSWHEAARYYREWYDATIGAVRSTPWVRRSSGWLLAILKQQNEEVHWDYGALPQLCDLAEARGLDTIGLFGWAEGGHDRWYPVYQPDEKMGGAARLRASIAEAHRRQKRIIIYANGQLIDQKFEYWDRQGQAIAVRRSNGTFAAQSWQKYKDTPARLHALACLGSEEWYRCMRDLALQAERLGADGILYDQLGMSGPMACYAQGHGHPVPAVVYTADRVRLLQRIADELRQVRSDFIIMTEGLHDAVLGSVTYFHGCVKGVFPPTAEELQSMLTGTGETAPFADMFRVTFPEVISTMRIPRPAEERAAANYACLYGFRHEIETRYAQDKAYLRDGVVPQLRDYDNIVSKPNVELMQQAAKEDSTRYLRAMVDFQRTHASLLWEGRFVGEAGFSLQGPKTLLAKAFVAENQIGVVVWNTGKDAATFSVSAPGRRFTQAWEPEKGAVPPESPLAPSSIRLLVGLRP